jgi:signal transduction histidine kinase
VVDRLSRLAEENEKMAEVMQLRHETMSFIVHDLRNPIGMALSALGIIQKEPDFDPRSDHGRFIMMAIGGLRRVLGLVDSLLDVERLDEGESALDRQDVDMSVLLGKIVEQQQPIAWTTKVDIVLHMPAGNHPPVVLADQNRIERVVVNLLDNALKFTPSGGQVTVSLDRLANQDMVEIAINDTGPGIPEDQYERVFDRFVQAKAQYRAKGFGLGLAFCRSAIEAHGGTIRAQAGDGGVGTKFVFTLPLKGAAS